LAEDDEPDDDAMLSIIAVRRVMIALPRFEADSCQSRRIPERIIRMADGELFIGWGQAVVGREQKALQVFNESIHYWTGLQQRGVIESFEPIILEPHGGDLGGFLLVHGEVAKLSQLRTNPEFIRLNGRAALVVTNFGAVMGFSGELLNKQFNDYEQDARELA
jgi:hypothetical protein